MTPFRIGGSAAANKINTNSPGMSDTDSSAVNSDSPDVTIIWKIIVGINQTHNPKINQ